MLSVPQLFEPSRPAWRLLAEAGSPWDAVLRVSELLAALRDQHGADMVHHGARVDPSAIVRDSYVAAGAEVYEGCVVRESIVMEGTIIGHCSEIARSIVLPNCMIPRFNYVGSSLLGEGVRLGGGTMLSTHRHDWQSLTLRIAGNVIELGANKFGALLGDAAHLAYGCHTNPATAIGARTVVMPLTDVTGYIPPDHTVVSKRRLVSIPRRFRKKYD